MHGYRDGADWKFKVEDIDAKAKEARSQKPVPPEEEAGGDVLLSEVALGQSGVGTSGTVIAMNALGSGSIGESDIQLAGSDIEIAPASTSPRRRRRRRKTRSTPRSTQFEELDLTLEEDLTLEDSSATLAGKTSPGGLDVGGGSAIDLSGKGLEDDDLVLGGSDKGSDVTIGGDSGISLVDPADSGLSLEQPLDLGGGGEESLELGEDDMLAPGEAGGSSPAQ